MSVASGSTCWRRYASVSRTRSSSNGIGLSTVFSSSGAGAALAIAVLASACAHQAPRQSARLWIGGDVFLGTGGGGALAGIAAIVGGAPGIVNLEGPVGVLGKRLVPGLGREVIVKPLLAKRVSG